MLSFYANMSLNRCILKILFIFSHLNIFHLHRLLLVNKDLPAAYLNWTERRIQRHAVRNSLVAEMKDKSNPFMEVCSCVSLLGSSIIS